MFNELPANRMMNILDTLAVEEAVRDGKANNAIEKARTQILVLYKRKMNRTGNNYGTYEPDDVTEYSPDEGYQVTDRDRVTGEFKEGVKVHNPSTFRLEPAADGSTDSPFA